MAWDESKHKRDENGQFTSKDGGGSGKKQTKASADILFNDYKVDKEKYKDLYNSFLNGDIDEIDTIAELGKISKNDDFDLTDDSDFELGDEWKDYSKKDNEKTSQGRNNFSGVDFEKKLPRNMRWKEYDFTDDGTLYWVTQEDFDEKDIQTFKNAMKEKGIEKAHLILRDDSTYDYNTDIANGEGIIINAKTNEITKPKKQVSKQKEIKDMDYDELTDYAMKNGINIQQLVEKALKDRGLL